MLLLYLVRRWTGDPIARAADALAWRTVGELAHLPMPPADAPLLAVLVRALEARAGIEPACKDLQSKG